MRAHRLGNGEHELGAQRAGQVSVVVSGTGTAVLGFKNNEGNFQAYIDLEATLTDDASIVCNCGQNTVLMASVTGASADFVVNVAQIRY